MRMLFVLFLVTPVLAGCIGSDADERVGTTTWPAPFTPPVPDFDFSTVIDPDHVLHSDPGLHDAGHGLTLVGHTGIGDVVPTGVPGSITSIDVWGELAVVSGFDGGLGFALVDISDPAAPVPLSAFLTRADGWTARFSADGNTVFYGCQSIVETLSGQTIPDVQEEACRGTGAPGQPAPTNMIVAVDVTDRKNPTFITELDTKAAHNLQTANIHGVEYVFTNAVEVLRFDAAAGTLEAVAEVPGVHDASVAQHPITGDWLMYTGAAGGTFAIYDVNDPASPEQIYSGGLEGVSGWHEQTQFPVVLDGRVLLALGGENSRMTGGLGDVAHIVDVTDPAQPVLLSSWAPPFDPGLPWTQYTFSVHEMAATPTGQLAIGWYHAGVWVLDVSTQERQAEPVVLAAFQPHEPINVQPSAMVLTPLPLVPFVWSANWDARGYLVVPDAHTGVYVLEPEWGLVPALDGGQ